MEPRHEMQTFIDNDHVQNNEQVKKSRPVIICAISVRYPYAPSVFPFHDNDPCVPRSLVDWVLFSHVSEQLAMSAHHDPLDQDIRCGTAKASANDPACSTIHVELTLWK